MSIPQEMILEIEQQGRITFARFMELALYHPKWGYYNSNQKKIGVDGDYYTNPSVHPAYGKSLARALAEMAGHLQGNIYLVEYGPGKGQMAAQILEEFKNNFPEHYGRLLFCLVEISSDHRNIQRLKLRSWEHKLLWVNSIKELTREDKVAACVVSNEFPDALPVHRLKLVDGVLQEIYVNQQDGKLVEELGPLSTSKIKWYLELAQLEPTEGQTVEVNLDSMKWLQEIDSSLREGFILTVDYGYLSEELKAPHRFDGTLLAYRKHTVVTNPYQAIGKQDLTAHVNFSALINQGEALGWQTLGYMKQNKFLTGAGILQLLPRAGELETKQSDLLAIKRLVMPEGMGETFKVLVQSTGIKKVDLSCLKGW